MVAHRRNRSGKGSDCQKSGFNSRPKLFRSSEQFEQLRIGSGKFVTLQLFCLNPAKCRATERLRFVRHPATTKEIQENGFFRIGMRYGLNQFKNFNFDSQFLTQFADQALFERFIRFAFATGKFPKPAEMRIRVALGDEKFAVAKNQASGNFNAARILRVRNSSWFYRLFHQLEAPNAQSGITVRCSCR